MICKRGHLSTALYQLCEPWLDLPQWLSDTFYECRQPVRLADCQQRAAQRNPMEAGRPRDAATSGDRFLLASRHREQLCFQGLRQTIKLSTDKAKEGQNGANVHMWR